MIILDTTTRSLQFVLTSAITTNQLPFVASYVDITTTTFTPGTTAGASNNTTAVALAAAPAALTQRQLKMISIFNSDTVVATLKVQYNDNATLRQLLQVTLQINETLQFVDGRGWFVLDAAGSTKENTIPAGVTLLNATQVEVDFGGNPTTSGSWTVIDPTVSATTPVLATQAGDAASDKPLMGDANALDPILFRAQPGAGQFTLYGDPLNGPVIGKYKVDYLVLPIRAAAALAGPSSLSIAVKAWFKASDFDTFADGADVAAWNDLSGNAFHTVAYGAAGLRPTVSKGAINGLTAVKSQSAASHRGLQNPTMPINPGNSTTVFAVVKFLTPGAGDTSRSCYFGANNGGAGGGGGRMGMNKANPVFDYQCNTGGQLSINSFIPGNWNYIIFVNTSGVETLYVNGVLWTWASGTATPTSAAQTGFNLLEGDNTPDDVFEGSMAELAFFNGAINGGDITALNNYARQKYGLS